MRALGKLKRELGIWMYDAPMPKINPNEVLVKVKKTGICGTDMHIYNWDAWAQRVIPVPMTVGHEFVGEIVEVGSEVKSRKLGERVSGENHLVCGECRHCRGGTFHFCSDRESIGVTVTGCFAEYVAMPATNVIPVPSEISDGVASILNPFGNSTYTALAFDLVGEDVLITGAGTTGMMAAAIAKHVGARHVVITDINDYRLSLAKKLGATRTVNVLNESLKDVMKELDMKEGFDVGLEMSGNPSAFRSMIEHMIHGGKIAILAFLPEDTTIDWAEINFKGLTLKGIYGREMYETWYKMISMLQSGLDISPVITHEIPADDYEEAFRVLVEGKSGKIILNWE